MKAILVLDKMPNSCEECIVRCDGYSAKEYAQRTIIKPDWCPLKLLPKRIPTNEYGYMTPYGSIWNACIDAITGETE